MLDKICVICLNSEDPLQKIDGELLKHYTHLTNNLGESLKTDILLSCCSCDKELNQSLEFKNKCIATNEILKKWTNNKKKTPIVPLKKLNSHKLKKNQSPDSLKLRYQSRSTKEKELTLKTENDDSQNKVEIDTFNAFDVINCDTLKSEIDEQNIKTEQNYEQISSEHENGEVEQDDNDSGDDEFLIDCVNKGVKAKKGTRVYTRKGINEFSKYEAVFDIQLFKTDEDAKKELLSRRDMEPYTSSRHRCELCYTVYKCEKLLQFHMKWHDSDAKFECDICRMRFASKKAERVHRAKCHRGKYSCRLCPLVTYYGNTLKTHFEKHQGKTHECHCGAVFKHISSFLSHARTVHVSAHACVHCARTFFSAKGLNNHRARRHQSSLKEVLSSGVSCSLCSLTFLTRPVFNVHVLTAHKHTPLADEIIACVYCGVSFDTPAEVKAHKRAKHSRLEDVHDIITCKLCGASGAGRTWRYRHYSRSHPQVDYRSVSLSARFMCDQCGRLFCNVTFLKRHMSTHLGLRPHAALERRRRDRAPPLVCAECCKEFRNSACYAKHMRIHAGVRRHECSTCSKSFLNRASLRAHERSEHPHERSRDTST